MNNSDEEFWKDLSSILGVTQRMPGDKDAEQISEEKGVSTEAARRIMKKMAATGKYSYQVVIDHTSPNGRRATVRAVLKHEGITSTS